MTTTQPPAAPLAAAEKLRPELVELCRRSGWPDAKLARALGCSSSALSSWLTRTAPFGLADALSDFADEAEAA